VRGARINYYLTVVPKDKYHSPVGRIQDMHKVVVAKRTEQPF